MASAVVLSGGGVGSAAIAARYARDHSLTLLHIDYGHPAAAAEHRALVAQMPSFPQTQLMRLTLPHVLELNRGPIGHAKAGVVQSPGGAASTGKIEAIAAASLRGLFPVLLSVGLQAANRIGAELLAIGVSRSTAAHLGLPRADEPGDLRRGFMHAFSAACDALLGKNRAVRVDAPLLDLTPAQVVQIAMRMEAPLAHTWSCLSSGSIPCGQCPGCRQRDAAFAESVRPDPLLKALERQR